MQFFDRLLSFWQFVCHYFSFEGTCIFFRAKIHFFNNNIFSVYIILTWDCSIFFWSSIGLTHLGKYWIKITDLELSLWLGIAQCWTNPTNITTSPASAMTLFSCSKNDKIGQFDYIQISVQHYYLFQLIEHPILQIPNILFVYFLSIFSR